MNNFKWSKINTPVFILAPMANITTLPFRSICKEMGADIVFTPMFSANAIIHNPKKTLAQARFLPSEQPVIVQIFGYDGELIAKAANIVQKELAPAGIDINMGCPAPKITGNECGSAFLRDYDKALEIAKTIRENYSGQLSIKIRLGWQEKDVKQFVKRLEEIGVDAVTIHGRTAKQGYSGEADWKMIEEIAASVKIPVIGNGDITTWQEAWNKAENNSVAGVMIGRGCLGNPWIFRDIRRHSDHRKNPDLDSTEKPTLNEIKETILKQANLSIDFLGNEEWAIRELRKHMGWYLKDFPNAKQLRKEAMLINTSEELKDTLSKLK